MRTLLLAAILDRLSLFMWDGQSEKPAMIVDRLLGNETDEDEIDKYSSPEEFWMARAEILRKLEVDAHA